MSFPPENHLALHEKPSPRGLSEPGTLSCALETDLLTTAKTISRHAQSGEWEALRLEYYFGPASRELRFKDCLVLFVWAARQRLIETVGAYYCRLTLTQRSERELALLVELDAVLQRELHALGGAKALHKITPEDTLRLVLSATFAQYPQIARGLAQIASQWVRAMVTSLKPA